MTTVVLYLFTYSLSATAQTVDDYQQDFTGTMAGYQDGPHIDVSLIAAGWMYEVNYDSSTILYTITELRRNRSVIKLLNWKNRRQEYGWDLMMFDDSSRTETLLLCAGDTLTFYREFEWYDRITGVRRPDNYMAHDTLTFLVELLRESDEERMALLDSFVVLRRDTPGCPVMLGARPMMARISYVVPASLPDDMVYIRLAARSAGAGDYSATRHSLRTVELSRQLDYPEAQQYLLEFGECGVPLPGYHREYPRRN